MIRVLAPADVPDLGAVLAVFAHPDDETYLAGGLLSALAEHGRSVQVVTATAGERGTDRPDRWPPDRLRATREWELTGALAALGVRRHRLLGFGDGELAGVSIDHGADLVAELVDQTRPDTIVTFGPDGVTGHADHMSIAKWVDHGLRRITRSPRVLAAVLDTEYCVRFSALHDELSVFMGPGGPESWPIEDLALRIELSGRWLDRKVAALRCQATQTAPIEAAIGEDLFREWVAVESFAELRPTIASGNSAAPSSTR